MVKRKTLVSILISLLLCVGLLPLKALAAPAAPSGEWTDYAADSFASGKGTKEDPYIINFPEQLAKLAKDINSGIADQEYTHNQEYFLLGNDIDLSAHRWIPIGSGTSTSSFHSFTGYFDGANKTISGLYVDESSEKFSAGLFGHVSGIEIKNVIIKDGYVKTEVDSKSQDAAGLLIGSAAQGYGLSTTVSNCHVSGTIESNSALTGGLAGYNSYGTYKDCSTDITINGHGCSGGFIGSDFSGNYENCTAKGNLSGEWSVGGFAGILFWESEAKHCIADVKVTANDWNAGGFVGYIEEKVTIHNCISYGDVHSKVNGWEPKVGGFTGISNLNCSIDNSYAAGKVTAASTDYKAGGFVGYDNGGKVTSCSYDAKKNPELKGVGETVTAGTNSILPQNNILSIICTAYYGDHDWDESKEIIKEKPTDVKEGSKGYLCKRCGDYKEIAKIKPTLPTHKVNIKNLKVKLSATKYTYNGKLKQPTVIIKTKNGKLVSTANYTVKYSSGRKNPGTYTVQVTMKGNYIGKKTLLYTICGKKMPVPKLKALSKALKVTWKKQKITGYQIQYSTNAKFKKATTVKIAKSNQTSRLIKKLKARKKYYVRIRSYKSTKIGGKTYNAYSAWSKAKTITVK